MTQTSRPAADGGPWARYVPDRQAPWSLRRVVHLHRRAGFAATWGEVQRDLKDGPELALSRLLDAEGKPLAGVQVSAQLSFKPEDNKDLPADVRFNGRFWFKLITGEATTDKDGKFRIEGLVPGLKYLLNVKKEMEFLTDYTRDGLTVESGKANDLGELKAKPKEAKERP